MFLLDSNDSSIIHAVSSILHQKEIVHTLDKKKKYFFKIEIIKNPRDIQLKGFSKIIKLDIPNRELNLQVDEEVLSGRLKDYNLPEPRYTSGVLYKYSKLVGGSDKGAVTN